MANRILPVAALLMGSAFLLFAGGINALILPVRGTSEGFSSFVLGLLGTAWALGHILGCVLTSWLVARVGHIRSFSVMCALAGLAVLLSLLLITPWAWIPARAVSGFCFAGAAMIVEGWLSERTDQSSRGALFGIYMTSNLIATTAGQMVITLGDPMGFVFFVLAAMFYMLALIPTAVSSSASPQPLVSISLNLGELYRRSPVSVVAAFFVGISNSAFGTLAAVYATGVGLTLSTVALFASVPVLTGALVQLPTGMISDRIDRRFVLIGTAFLALAADVTFLTMQPTGAVEALAAVGILGAGIFTMYPLLVAHANDHALPETYVLTSGGLLLVFGIGAVCGPLIGGVLMQSLGLYGLFLTTASAHVIIIVYTLWRISIRAAVPDDQKSTFVFHAPTRSLTPQTDVLAPLAEETEDEPSPAATGS